MQSEELQTGNNGISLKDIVAFFKRNRMQIVIFGLVGLLFSTAYVVLTPKSYEARWQLQMAQFVNSNSNSNNSNSNSNSNSEEPAALIQRLRMPTVYPVEVRQSCGISEDGDFKDYLDGNLKIDMVKNVPNSVEMKIRSSSPGQAMKCAEAVTAMIVAQQRSMIEERLAGRQGQLAEYQKALADEQQQLGKIKKTELGNFGYLAKLDRLSWLRARMDALREEALLSQLHPAKFVTPIYVPVEPITPKVKSVLLFGALLGLMLGVLRALGCERWYKLA